jgi:hypothetical protein
LKHFSKHIRNETNVCRGAIAIGIMEMGNSTLG